MLNFDNFRSIASALDNGSNLNKETKQELKTLIKDILEVKDAQEIREKVVEIKNKIINELKQDTTLRDEAKAALKTELTEEVKTQLKTDLTEEVKTQLKADQATITAAKVKLKTEQLKQGNAARYTAGIGVGLASGLIAFTALERTVKLEMLVMIDIAVASALVAGGITYAVLPGTQVDGAKAQKVNEPGKNK